MQDDWSMSEKFGLSLGLRYGYFIKDADERFQGLEPRMALRYRLNKTASIKASFDYRRQYIHQISNTTAPTPVDIWQVSRDFLPPQAAQNYSFGFFQNINKNRWETSLELFYKDMQNLSTYKDFAQLLANPNLGDALVSGIGKAWGAEARIGLRRGRWTGWLSYTYSRSLLQVKHDDPESSINDGAWFPANFDIPHAFSLVANAKLGKKSTFSLTGTYRSGRPYTALVASYEVGTVSVPHYSDRNAYRIPDYIRLDASLTIGSFINTVDDKLVFSVYNLLARKNAFSVFYTRPERVLIPKPFKLSVLGAAFPSVTYRIAF
ncbi:MAG: TonB-dependent receptor [Bacteroidia bacterium]